MKYFAIALALLVSSGCTEAQSSYVYEPKIVTNISFECIDGILVLDVVQTIDDEEAATLHQIAQYPTGQIVQCVQPVEKDSKSSLQSKPRMV